MIPQEVVENPPLAVPYYLMSVYLYDYCATPALSDQMFDGVCGFLVEHWEHCDHRHRHLIDRDALQACTCVGYRPVEFPSIIKSAAHRWLAECEARSASMIRIGDPVTFEIEGYSQGVQLHHYTPTQPCRLNPNPEPGSMSCKTTYHASIVQAAMHAAKLDAIAKCTAETIVEEMEKTRLAICNALGLEESPPPKAKREPIKGAVERPTQPQYRMTEKAVGCSLEQFHSSGWTDEQLLQHGYMELMP